MQLDWLWFLYRVFQKYGCLYFDQLRPILGQVIFAGDLQTCQAEQMYKSYSQLLLVDHYFLATDCSSVMAGEYKKRAQFFFRRHPVYPEMRSANKTTGFPIPHTPSHTHVCINIVYLFIYLSIFQLFIYLLISIFSMYLSIYLFLKIYLSIPN